MLLVERSFSEIACIPMIHSGHMINVRATRAEGNRLFSGLHRLVMAALERSNVPDDQVGLGIAGIHRQSLGRAFQRRLESCGSVLFPTKSSLVSQSETEHVEPRREDGVYFQNSFELNSGLRMSVLGKILVKLSAFQEKLID